jgi:tyrosine decarboxylase / aspartate 1-decarboxylase
LLTRSRQAAIVFHERLAADRRFLVPFAPELDILVWAVRAPSIAASSQLAKRIFAGVARENLHLALTQLPLHFFPAPAWPCENTSPTPEASVTCLRSVLMKPEHLEWLDTIWSKLDQVTDEVLANLNVEKSQSDEQ